MEERSASGTTRRFSPEGDATVVALGFWTADPTTVASSSFRRLRRVGSGEHCSRRPDEKVPGGGRIPPAPDHARPEIFTPSLREILGWISSGDLELTIGARYPLEKATETHEALEGRKTISKIILNP